MNWAAALAAITAASQALKSGVDLTQAERDTHAKNLDDAFSALQDHIQQIKNEGPALPPGPLPVKE